MATHTTRETSGWHPLSMVAFTTLLLGGTFSALWLVTLNDLPDNKPTNIVYGVVALTLLLTTAGIFAYLSQKVDHSPMLPDNTPEEIKRYLTRVRG
ncbi:hypothetical protein GOHSU_05_00050 [Gordonia hirsuta DSM 44140 = NBRC 16056]|uniref:Uncharacterized protein n=1 Tax=Gordonia hirsuta DSM 44140 = NBRC 16056 TaxID=1121927 RepID=L7L6I7_9ACTN|nr:hypothetical protein [Gordonia hirsuta]GAC56366.1 hypothetical protein GOHSU_05_00050 [Gordonia hirsuta DSM 44140 = NBRC 16056]